MRFFTLPSILNGTFTMFIIFFKIIVFFYSVVPQSITYASLQPAQSISYASYIFYCFFRHLQMTESKSTLILGSLGKNQ